LGLEGKNSHMADDDILATFELAKFCHSQAEQYLVPQYEFLLEKKTSEIIEELFLGYKECYDFTLRNLYKLYDDKCELAIISEMREMSDKLGSLCEFRLIDTLEMILSFLKEDVISKDEPNALKAHFSNHLMDMSTYREADLCSSSNFKEKLFVSTVHKAKGLEFENVIVLRSIDGRYPHFAYITDEQKDESKRLFYVAISRARKRLIVSGSSASTFTPYIRTILHRFTLRSRLSDKYFIEISSSELKLYFNKVLIRHYLNIHCVYNYETIRNQFDLKKFVASFGCNVELPDKLDSFFRQRSIFSKTI
jgi:DNA helicase-2/ATP-dependent DNA helicase PcrA